MPTSHTPDGETNGVIRLFTFGVEEVKLYTEQQGQYWPTGDYTTDYYAEGALLYQAYMAVYCCDWLPKSCSDVEQQLALRRRALQKINALPECNWTVPTGREVKRARRVRRVEEHNSRAYETALEMGMSAQPINMLYEYVSEPEEEEDEQTKDERAAEDEEIDSGYWTKPLGEVMIDLTCEETLSNLPPTPLAAVPVRPLREVTRRLFDVGSQEVRLDQSEAAAAAKEKKDEEEEQEEEDEESNEHCTTLILKEQVDRQRRLKRNAYAAAYVVRKLVGREADRGNVQGMMTHVQRMSVLVERLAERCKLYEQVKRAAAEHEAKVELRRRRLERTNEKRRREAEEAWQLCKDCSMDMDEDAFELDEVEADSTTR